MIELLTFIAAIAAIPAGVGGALLGVQLIERLGLAGRWSR